MLDPLRPWTKVHAPPVIPATSFRALWKEQVEQTNKLQRISGASASLDAFAQRLREFPAPKHAGPVAPEQVFAPFTNPLERFHSECAKNNTECIVFADDACAADTVAESARVVARGRNVCARRIRLLREHRAGMDWP